jgi:small-conductance mechanosensitive channel
MSIVLDRPFEIGDFIVVSEQMGTVEYIGLKTTRLRSLSGEQIVFSNNDLLNSRIHNFKRMAERRVQFSFGVVYQTPANMLERIPTMVREIIEQQTQTRFDRAHFQSYGDSSLNFEIVYYVLDQDYNLYMDRQQAINLALYRRFESEHIEFAYPTRTLYVQGNATPKSTQS